MAFSFGDGFRKQSPNAAGYPLWRLNSSRPTYSFYSSDKLDLKYADQGAASMATGLASAGKERLDDDV